MAVVRESHSRLSMNAFEAMDKDKDGILAEWFLFETDESQRNLRSEEPAHTAGFRSSCSAMG